MDATSIAVPPALLNANQRAQVRALRNEIRTLAGRPVRLWPDALKLRAMVTSTAIRIAKSPSRQRLDGLDHDSILALGAQLARGELVLADLSRTHITVNLPTRTMVTGGAL